MATEKELYDIPLGQSKAIGRFNVTRTIGGWVYMETFASSAAMVFVPDPKQPVIFQEKVRQTNFPL